MTKPFDDALKKLMRAGAHDFLPFVQLDLQVDNVLPTDLDKEHVHADGLLRCHDAQGNAMLAHFEFQRNQDTYMGERLMEYSLLASREHDYLPIISCVIYLNKDKTVPHPPFIRKLPNGSVTSTFNYVCVHIGQIKAQDLLAMDRSTLVPLLPLTDGGNTIEQVDIMVKKLLEEVDPDLLWVGIALAGIVLKNQSDLEWLRRRRALVNHFLARSAIYEDSKVEGRAEGLAEGEAIGRATEKLLASAASRQRFAASLQNQIAKQFPALLALARQCVEEPKNDHDVLIQLVLDISSAQTEQEVRCLLEATVNPA